MINTKVLLKAMSFMFLPTLSLLGIIFCWFLDWQAFIQFITAKTVGAGLIRLVMLGLEIALTYYMYKQYSKEEAQKELAKIDDETTDMLGEKIRDNLSYYDEIRNLIPSSAKAEKTQLFKKTDNLFIIKVIPKKS